MTIKVNLPGQRRRIFKIRYWYVPFNDIYAVMRAMKQYKGVVFGVYYNREHWKARTRPKPVSPQQAQTAHAIYGFENGWDRGQEAIIADSTWPSAKVHYIINDYFKVGGVFSPIVMEVKEINNMDQVLFVVSNGRYGFISVNDGRIIGGALAANPAEVKVLQKVFEYPREVVNADGSFITPDATLNY